MLRRRKTSASELKRDLSAHGGALSMSQNTRSFFNFSQLVLSAGHLKPPPALKHSKITYFEVEILDVHSKKQICIVDKVSVLFQYVGDLRNTHGATSRFLFRLRCDLLSYNNFCLLLIHSPHLLSSKIFTNEPTQISFRLCVCIWTQNRSFGCLLMLRSQWWFQSMMPLLQNRHSVLMHFQS